ncbi:MAG TPA: hypothetical protein VMU60_06700 [Syntrophobacteria bacterium]|nr:hypothetical protein [Syntrophobacteria bacterium]
MDLEEYCKTGSLINASDKVCPAAAPFGRAAKSLAKGGARSVGRAKTREPFLKGVDGWLRINGKVKGACDRS